MFSPMLAIGAKRLKMVGLRRKSKNMGNGGYEIADREEMTKEE